MFSIENRKRSPRACQWFLLLIALSWRSSGGLSALLFRPEKGLDSLCLSKSCLPSPLVHTGTPSPPHDPNNYVSTDTSRKLEEARQKGEDSEAVPEAQGPHTILPKETAGIIPTTPFTKCSPSEPYHLLP